LSVLVAFHRERKSHGDFADALRDIETGIAAKHRPKWLARLRAACGEKDCDCAKVAAGLGLDAEASDAVLVLLTKAERCAPRVAFEGLRAEALVRNGDALGPKEAASVLERSARDPNALYAQALSSYRARAFAKAMALAESSERAGRGFSATLLLGVIAYQAGDGERARRSFRELLSADPDDVDALFNLGVTAQGDGRYGEARSSYLRVTRLVPGHADARYNLAILTHSVGALDEANHHLEKFVKNSPSDPRLAELRAALAAPPEHGPALSPTAPPVPSVLPERQGR